LKVPRGSSPLAQASLFDDGGVGVCAAVMHIHSGVEASKAKMVWLNRGYNFPV